MIEGERRAIAAHQRKHSSPPTRHRSDVHGSTGVSSLKTTHLVRERPTVVGQRSERRVERGLAKRVGR